MHFWKVNYRGLVICRGADVGVANPAKDQGRSWLMNGKALLSRIDLPQRPSGQDENNKTTYENKE
jgi:hypothetical protein